MFPFFDAGPQLSIALTVLYALLAAVSLSIRLAARGAAPSMLHHQVAAWWRIFPIVTLALLAYPFGLPALCLLVCVLAVVELHTHYEGRYFHPGAAGILLATIGIGVVAPTLAPPLVAIVLAIGALCYWRRPGRGALIWLILLVTTGAMLVLATFTTLPFGEETNLAWALYLFILTALNDIAQFVSGKLFGRHKIAPGVSPNKTWQGLAGGIVISLVVSLALGTYLRLAGPLTLAWFAFVLSLAGFAGDLMFSAAKRRLGIKDFSTLIPGHGGILDRVDSLVLTAPLLYCLLHIFEQGPT
ncbi:phosphatidate cytidylyltransferase [Massilia aurea]|uniref:phosphatidate cytidylyltransferase n=1 Tax=Massilia aurea TaxID=373040 RepID=UPI0034618710